nr:DUF2059 domain-containing protein [Planctomycetota bacterium]
MLRLLVIGLALQSGTAVAEQAATLPAPAPVASGPARREDIRKLLMLTGADKIALQVVAQMVGSFKVSAPNVPQSFWDQVVAEIDPKDFVEMAVPAYERHLTAADVAAAIAFYETAGGRNFVAAQPLIIKDTMAAGETWGAALGAKIAARLQEQQ